MPRLRRVRRGPEHLPGLRRVHHRCMFDAITLEKKYDGKMVPIEKAPETVMMYAVERQQKIVERRKRDQAGDK